MLDGADVGHVTRVESRCQEKSLMQKTVAMGRVAADVICCRSRECHMLTTSTDRRTV